MLLKISIYSRRILIVLEHPSLETSVRRAWRRYLRLRSSGISDGPMMRAQSRRLVVGHGCRHQAADQRRV